MTGALQDLFAPGWVVASLALVASTFVLRPSLARVAGPGAVKGLDRSVIALLATTSVAALAMAAATDVPVRWHSALVSELRVSSATLYIDRVSLVVLAAVAWVGAVVYRFSLRCLKGDPRQGRFLAWLGFVLCAVQWLILSGHLLQLSVAWIAVSMGLHALLTHYERRPRAWLAARKKFLVSRLGDLALLGAVAMLQRGFGTLDLAELFEAARTSSAGAQPESVSWALACLVLAAICKSAQFPLHSWLPETIEAPTPVSALMHAGIVNAGGYLIVRTSPLFELDSRALTVLAVVGGVTAVLGTLSMLTQSDVKRKLAWSTVGQMGFMMMQCGVGAFGAALLHLLGHGFYKAHAFLGSGELQSAVHERAPVRSLADGLGKIVQAWVLGAAAAWALHGAFGVHPSAHPGGWVLWIAGVLTLAPWWLAPGASLARFVGMLAMGATAASLLMTSEHLLASALGTVPALYERGAAGQLATAVVLGGLLLLTLADTLLPGWFARGRGVSFYLACRHGFYLGDYVARWVQSLWPAQASGREPALERKLQI